MIIYRRECVEKECVIMLTYKTKVMKIGKSKSKRLSCGTEHLILFNYVKYSLIKLVNKPREIQTRSNMPTR